MLVVRHQQFRFEISLIQKNDTIYGVFTLKARDQRLVSNIIGWLSSSVKVVRIYYVIRNETDNCFLQKKNTVYSPAYNA